MSREIMFRGKSLDDGQWIYGYYFFRDYKPQVHFIIDDSWTEEHRGGEMQRWVFDGHGVDPATVGQFTGLKDRRGTPVYEGDRLRFYGRRPMDEVWDGTVTFEDGVFTVSIHDAKIFKNPDGWDMPHDWTKSRHWGRVVGYGEYGTWNCARRALVAIDSMFEDSEKYLELGKKYGWPDKGRFINAEVIGNVHENHELLEASQ